MELNIPAIGGVGDSLIYLVDRYGDRTIYDIDFRPTDAGQANGGVGITYVDHLTHNVHRGHLDEWAGYYERLFNFRETRYFDIEGKLTGLVSRAMTSPCGKIRIPINESTDDKSQIEEYLRAYKGEGNQHIALGTDDIFATVAALRRHGVEFMEVPGSYYDAVDERLPGHGHDIEALRQNRVLIDGAPSEGPGLLLQIFTQTVIGPIFFELIQRKGNEGFYGPATHMYHAHPPTAWTGWQGPLRPRAFDIAKLDRTAPSPFGSELLFANAHVRYRLWRTSGAMARLARNADGDELIFVHRGAGELYCDFGHLSYREGDYIVLPRGTMWRLETHDPLVALLIEATDDALLLPDKGPAGEHAIFDPAILDVPAIDDAFRAQQAEESWQVEVKRRGEISTVTYPFNPLDAVGWKGTLLPVRLNWRDIRPLMSHRYHLPPSVHTTFAARRFVICTFVPRPLESDPGALRLPFFHANDDYDEVIFYHRGQFISRDNIHPGMITLHPAGVTHGPHPQAHETGARRSRAETDEVAVVMDTRDALDVSTEAGTVEWPDYVESWKVKAAE